MAKILKKQEIDLSKEVVFDENMGYLYNQFLINGDAYRLVGTELEKKTKYKTDAIDEIRNVSTGLFYKLNRTLLYSKFLEGKVLPYGDKNEFKNAKK